MRSICNTFTSILKQTNSVLSQETVMVWSEPSKDFSEDLGSPGLFWFTHPHIILLSIRESPSGRFVLGQAKKNNRKIDCSFYHNGHKFLELLYEEVHKGNLKEQISNSKSQLLKRTDFCSAVSNHRCKQKLVRENNQRS